MGQVTHAVKTRTVIGLFAVAVLVIPVKWKFAASAGAASAIHGYHGICNAGVGEPYSEFMHELRKLAESGDTNKLLTVLRRAAERSSDIYSVWLYEKRDAYLKSTHEILQ